MVCVHACRCVTYGEVGGLYAGGATQQPESFNCDSLRLPFACEQITGGTPWLTTPASCVSAADLEVCPYLS